MINKRERIESLIKETMTDFEWYVFPKYIDNYKVYLWFILDRLWDIESWQSNVDYPLVASIVDTMFANIYDSSVKFNISDRKLRELCNKAYDFRQTWKNVISEVAKEAFICWKAFARDFLLKEESEEDFSNLWIKLNISIKKPTIEYISIFDVFYDRSMGIKRSPFKITRTYITWEDIKRRSKMLWMKKIIKKDDTEEQQEQKIKSIDSLIDKVILTAKDTKKPFSLFNCNLVKDLSNTSPILLNKLRSESAIKNTFLQFSWSSDNLKDKNNFFLSKDQNVFEFVVYTDSEDMYYYVDWILLFEWKKTHNIWEIREVRYSIIPWTWNSQGIADKVWWLQYMLNGLWNAYLDNTKMLLSDMYEVVWNSPFVRNWKIDFKKFWAFRVNQHNSVRRMEMWVKEFSPLNYIQSWVEIWQQISWVNQYIMGWQWRAERVSGWVDLILNQYKSKLTPLTDSINQMMSDVARSWILTYLKYFTSSELLKLWINIENIENDKWKQIWFKVNWIDIRDLLDEDNISFSFDALHKIELENKRAALKENFQYVLQYAQNKTNLPEYMKAILWFDFDIDKIFLDEWFKEWSATSIVEWEEKIEGLLQSEDTLREEWPVQYNENALTENDLSELENII